VVVVVGLVVAVVVVSSSLSLPLSQYILTTEHCNVDYDNARTTTLQIPALYNVKVKLHALLNALDGNSQMKFYGVNE